MTEGNKLSFCFVNILGEINIHKVCGKCKCKLKHYTVFYYTGFA